MAHFLHHKMLFSIVYLITILSFNNFNKYSKNVLISSYNRTYIIIILSNVTDNPSKSRTLIKDWLEISQLNQINLLLIFYMLPPLSCHALHFVLIISILRLRYWRNLFPIAWPTQVFDWENVTCFCIHVHIHYQRQGGSI